MINAILYSEELEKAGFTKDQANKSVKIWMELMNQNFAMKEDLELGLLKTREFILREFSQHKLDVSKEIASINKEVSSVKSDFRNFEVSVKKDLDAIESRMTIKLGKLMVTSISLSSAIVTMIVKFL